MRAPAEDMQSLEIPEQSMLPVVPALEHSLQGHAYASKAQQLWVLGVEQNVYAMALGHEVHASQAEHLHWRHEEHSRGPEMRDLGCPSLLTHGPTCALLFWAQLWPAPLLQPPKCSSMAMSAGE